LVTKSSPKSDDQVWYVRRPYHLWRRHGDNGESKSHYTSQSIATIIHDSILFIESAATTNHTSFPFLLMRFFFYIAHHPLTLSFSAL
jgi:hypothetical protein